MNVHDYRNDGNPLIKTIIGPDLYMALYVTGKGTVTHETFDRIVENLMLVEEAILGKRIEPRSEATDDR